MDVMTPEQRKNCMAKIRSRDTKPEIRLRKALWAKGLRYRLHYDLLGRPDIVFPKYKIAIFCDGCFWHGCPKHSKTPKTNAGFWQEKIIKNMERDREVNHLLMEMGWIVLRFWEHEIKDDLENVICRVMDAMGLTSNE